MNVDDGLLAIKASNWRFHCFSKRYSWWILSLRFRSQPPPIHADHFRRRWRRPSAAPAASREAACSTTECLQKI